MLSPALLNALSQPGGIKLFEFLRGFFYTETKQGSLRAWNEDEEQRSLMTQAQTLGLVDVRAGSEAHLTPLGFEIANFSKEYCNWIDGGRALPEGITADMLRGRRVLDVGCSFGRHLVNFEKHGAKGFGIELQENYLRLSRVFAHREAVASPRLARARAESLPFPDRAFDLVYCRLVLNYVNDVDHTIGEFTRVLAPGGAIVIVVETLAVQVRALVSNRWFGNLRRQGFRVFGLLNTTFLHVTGRPYALAVAGRMHARHSPSWPSLRWLGRRFEDHGLVPFDGRSFVAARQPAGLLRARRPT